MREARYAGTKTRLARAERNSDKVRFMAHGNHDHSHEHSGHDRAFAIGIALNLVFVVIESVYGVLSHSMALLADAGHNLSDVLALALAWGASVLGRREPSQRFTYGLGSSTILAALVNAMLLMLVVGGIAVEAVQRLMNPVPVASMTVIWVALCGIVVNTATALRLTGRLREGHPGGPCPLIRSDDRRGSVGARRSLPCVSGWRHRTPPSQREPEFGQGRPDEIELARPGDSVATSPRRLTRSSRPPDGWSGLSKEHPHCADAWAAVQREVADGLVELVNAPVADHGESLRLHRNHVWELGCKVRIAGKLNVAHVNQGGSLHLGCSGRDDLSEATGAARDDQRLCGLGAERRTQRIADEAGILRSHRTEE